MNVQGMRILVVGMAKSGVAAAKFLRGKQAQVCLTDMKPREAQAELAEELEALGIQLILGAYPAVTAADYQLVVTSPGVPLTIPPIAAAYQEQIPVISEIELAYRYSKAPIVAVTGTNGKTTTTTLLGEMFRQAGKQVCVAGNIGLPLISEIEKYPAEAVIVVEVSSFQLETIEEFKPKVGIILNLTPDHLDRHGTMENYGQAKANIFVRQTAEDFTVLNYDDPLLTPYGEQSRGNVIFFSRVHKLTQGVGVEAGMVVVKTGQAVQQILPAAEIKIPGAHNLENALAAVATGWAMGLTPASMAATLRSFPGVAHRLEFVAERKGVTYINDSKGTNPDASIKALEAYRQPIVLIAGGKNKGSDFTEFAQKIKEKARGLVLVGQAADEIAQAAQTAGVQQILHANTFEETVHLAASIAQPGDLVVLSPACASWDMFNNFEERGDLFRKVVLELPD